MPRWCFSNLWRAKKSSAVRYRATLSYDGTAYCGFQRQVEAIPTIQAEVEKAISAVLGHPVTIVGAGRTDTGVHARGQVIAFAIQGWRYDDQTLLRAINANLPADIALQDIAPAMGFHPRFDALSRSYVYTIINAPQPQPLWRRYAWWIYGELDTEAMQQAAALLVGEHNFATFGSPPQGSNTVRHVLQSYWTVYPESFGQRLVYQVEANAFLYHMVRRMVGLQVQVGQKRLSLAEFEAAFRACNMKYARMIAPPQGLVLDKVTYPPMGEASSQT